MVAAMVSIPTPAIVDYVSSLVGLRRGIAVDWGV